MKLGKSKLRFVLLILCVAFAAGYSEESIWGANKTSLVESGKTTKSGISATIIETKLVCKEPGKYKISGYKIDDNGHLVSANQVLEPNRYLGWPTITKMKSGELIIAYSGDRDSHVCPWGKTKIIRSTDNGKTWSLPITITNTPLDDRDAGIIETKEGTLLVSWFTSLAFNSPSWKSVYERYARVGEKISKETRDKWLGNWTKRSVDGGKTWFEPSKTVATAPHGPIQLRDGRILYVGTGNWNGKFSVIVEQSDDDGITWKVVSTIPSKDYPMSGLSEPHVVELRNGKLIAMVRHEPQDRNCYLLQSESNDGGKTWTPLHQTNIWGYPPHLIELDNGWLVVAYGYRKDPYGERACISRDEGKTWEIDNEIILTSAPNAVLGYPACVQLDVGSILTVYYQQDVPGEPTSLFTTHWKIEAK